MTKIQNESRYWKRQYLQHNEYVRQVLASARDYYLTVSSKEQYRLYGVLYYVKKKLVRQFNNNRLRQAFNVWKSLHKRPDKPIIVSFN